MWEQDRLSKAASKTDCSAGESSYLNVDITQLNPAVHE